MPPKKGMAYEDKRKNMLDFFYETVRARCRR
jgi:hypothetical protein